MNFSRFAASLVFVLALTGCALGSTETVQNYVLPTPEMGLMPTPLRLSLQVMPVEVASGLDTARIALIENDVQMNYLAESRWAEPLPEMLQNLWIDALRQSRVAASVSSDSSGAKADRFVHITANAFNAVRKENGDIVVRISYEAKVLAPVTNAVLSVDEADVEQKALGSSKESVIQAFKNANMLAMRELIQKLAGKIATEQKAR